MNSLKQPIGKSGNRKGNQKLEMNGNKWDISKLMGFSEGSSLVAANAYSKKKMSNQ